MTLQSLGAGGPVFDNRSLTVIAVRQGSPAPVSPGTSPAFPPATGSTAILSLTFAAEGIHTVTVAAPYAGGTQTGTFLATVLPETADTDGDSIPDMVELTLGTAPNVAGVPPISLAAQTGGQQTVVFAARPLQMNGRSAVVELSNNLVTWTGVTGL